MKASAIAYPIQGLIKYHGLKDERLRLPYHDSISVCTAPLRTLTTIEFGYDHDYAAFDGKEATGRAFERILDVIRPLRERAGERSGFKMASENNFQSNIGLGASASGFAALAMAAAEALGLDLSNREVSTYARLGAGSASRAVAGGFSIWYEGIDSPSSYAEMLASSKELDMGIVAVLVPALKSTESAHATVTSSPFFRARVEYVHDVIPKMVQAIKDRDIERIGELAELDTLLLHGITMTGIDQLFLWRPETVQVILAVRQMRSEGMECHFSIDTGATVYVNSPLDRMREVSARLDGLGMRTLECHVGDESRIVEEHLF